MCPFDRMEATVDGLQLPLRSFCNLLNDLKISCSFQSCRKYVRLNELSEHTKNCIHNPINDEKEIDCSKGLFAILVLMLAPIASFPNCYEINLCTDFGGFWF